MSHVVPPLALALLLLGPLTSTCGDAQRAPVAADGWGPSHGLGAPAPAEDPQRPPVPRPRAVPPEQRAPWARADELDELIPLPGRGPSEHYDGGYERSLRINEAAAAYRQLIAGRPLPVGALVAQAHHPPESDAVVSWYVMEKMAGGRWRFLVVDPEGRVAAEEGLEPCRRCHVEAPHDHLFGPPPTTQRFDDAP